MKLLKFEQLNCAPCTTLSNILEHELKVKADESINLSTDGDEAMELAGIYGIMQTPTLILLDEMGVVVSRVSGADLEKVKEIVKLRGLI